MSKVANRRRIGTRWLLALVAGACTVGALVLTAPAATAAAATRLETGLPPSVGVGQAVTFQVAATDATGAADPDFRDRIRFTSSDALAGLPSDYTYTITDAGRHSFTVTFGTVGQQTLTIVDATNNSISGQATTTVGGSAVCDPRFNVSGCANTNYCDPTYAGTSYYNQYCYGNGNPCTLQYPNYDPRCNTGYYPPNYPYYPPPTTVPYYQNPSGYGNYGYGYGTVTAAPASLNPGDSTVVSGSGFRPGDTVDISMNNGQSLGTTVVDPAGNFRQTVTVPAGTAGGSYTLLAVSRTRSQQAQTPITVSGTAAAPLGYSTSTPVAQTVSRIPFTGARENRLVAIALALIFGGMMLLSGKAVLRPHLARRRG